MLKGRGQTGRGGGLSCEAGVQQQHRAAAPKHVLICGGLTHGYSSPSSASSGSTSSPGCESASLTLLHATDIITKLEGFFCVCVCSAVCAQNNPHEQAALRLKKTNKQTTHTTKHQKQKRAHNLFIHEHVEVSYRRFYHPCPLAVQKLKMLPT